MKNERLLRELYELTKLQIEAYELMLRILKTRGGFKCPRGGELP